MRTGIGHDIHRLIPTIKQSAILLGSIPIPCFYRVQAHSDGDVLLHALVDACLGALALGDIGQWFPDTDAKNQDRPSSDFVKEVVQHLGKMGWQIVQLDSTIFLEEPHLAPHVDAIRQQLAKLLGTELSAISVKAKTMEGLGPIGDRKALSAEVVVTAKEMHHAPSAHQ